MDYENVSTYQHDFKVILELWFFITIDLSEISIFEFMDEQQLCKRLFLVRILY